MLSPFLKKLLFVRQFLIDKGQIEILGENQVMLPSTLLAELQTINPEKTYTIVKKHINSVMKTYAKKMGSTDSGLLKSSQDIFETFGLGQFKILKLDNSKKIVNIAIKNSSISNNSSILEASLDGMFSFLFKSNVNIESKKGAFIIKKR